VTILCSLLVLLAPEQEMDELEALQIVVQRAMETIEPSVVTIETVGGIRQVDLPDGVEDKVTLPERPREDRKRPEGAPEREPSPEGRTPRFENEWQKMLALPGFKKAEGPTTGLVLSEDGYIVTSAWNFESKPNVVAVTTPDGRTHAAKLLGMDRAAGLALVKIDAEGLKVPEFVDPATAKPGAWAFAIGRAVARQAVTVKYGILSARNRIEGNALQTDAATNPTNYGGPLVDAEGRVYGVVVPLGARGEEANPNWYDSGIGFAAPIRDPRRLIERLKEPDTELFPAFLGVVTDQERTEPGARITQVAPEQGAAKAGLLKDDVVLKVDDRDVRNAFTLRFEVGRRRAGDPVRLLVRRGDKTFEVEATLGRRPQGAAEDDEKIPVPMPGTPEKDKKKDDG